MLFLKCVLRHLNEVAKCYAIIIKNRNNMGKRNSEFYCISGGEKKNCTLSFNTVKQILAKQIDILYILLFDLLKSRSPL